MKSKCLLALPVQLALIVMAVPLLAHHSFDAEYDRSKPLTLTGTVT